MRVSAQLQQVLPYGLGGLALLVVLIWAAQQFFGEMLKTAGGRAPDALARRMSSGRKLRGRRLRRYRKAVQHTYATHPLGFERGTVDIRKVYVPLQYEDGERREDIYSQVQSRPRTVIVGDPGAGKSLLLKNSMLLWATEGDGRRVPVLVELHRCNTTGATVRELIVEELRRCGIGHGAAAYAERSLEEGQLRLLFDGLDEVGRAEHGRVVRELRDLAREYPDCQMVITCRATAYFGQLEPEFPHVVRVAEFDDAAIRRFLHNWPDMEDSAEADRLFEALRKNPALMRMARSPLLLTMIAYLSTRIFVRTGKTLPNSRPAFYGYAIGHLLGRDREMGRSEGISLYEPPDKLAVLQRVALTLQEAEPGVSDRLSISRSRLYQVTRGLLPDLNLGEEHVKPLVDEIVERSQLLVALDKDGQRYGFRHLTLQEYLAARELAEEPDRLLRNYLADPDSWRETLRMWCAVGSRECTSMVRAVFGLADERQRVLALECLADARRIEESFADEVVEHFMSRLVAPEVDSSIARAFGAVAADDRPRGQKVFALLTRLAESRSDGWRGFTLSAEPADEHTRGVGSGPLIALAHSGRQEAAEVLARLANTDTDARQALGLMGELAIPALAGAADAGHLWAVDELAGVATPAAAEHLAGLLWSEQAPVAYRAAWWLAGLLRDPAVELALAGVSLPDSAALSKEFEFIWWPFSSEKQNVSSLLAARIAELIGRRDVETLPPAPDGLRLIDARVGIPVAALRIVPCGNIELDSDPEIQQLLRQNRLPLEPARAIPELLGSLQSGRVLYLAGRLPEPTANLVRLRDRILQIHRVPQSVQEVIRRLSWPVQARLLSGELATRTPWWTKDSQHKFVRNNWQTVQSEVPEIRLPHRILTVVLWLLGVAASLIALARITAVLPASFGWEWAATWSEWKWGNTWASWIALGALGAVLIAFFAAIAAVIADLDPDDAPVAFGVFALVLVLSSAVLLVAVPTVAVVTLSEWCGPIPTAVGIFAWSAVLLVRLRAWRRRKGIADNPFRVLLSADGGAARNRTSVLAR